MDESRRVRNQANEDTEASTPRPRLDRNWLSSSRTAFYLGRCACRTAQIGARFGGCPLIWERGAECYGQPHSVPWMLRARYAVSVSVITSAALGRRRSSRPVGYAVGNIGIPLPTSGRWENSIGISPTGILDPLGGSEGRGRGENNSSGEYRFQFHGTNS